MYNFYFIMSFLFQHVWKKEAPIHERLSQPSSRQFYNDVFFCGVYGVYGDVYGVYDDVCGVFCVFYVFFSSREERVLGIVLRDGYFFSLSEHLCY